MSHSAGLFVVLVIRKFQSSPKSQKVLDQTHLVKKILLRLKVSSKLYRTVRYCLFGILVYSYILSQSNLPPPDNEMTYDNLCFDLFMDTVIFDIVRIENRLMAPR